MRPLSRDEGVGEPALLRRRRGRCAPRTSATTALALLRGEAAQVVDDRVDPAAVQVADRVLRAPARWPPVRAARQRGRARWRPCVGGRLRRVGERHLQRPATRRAARPKRNSSSSTRSSVPSASATVKAAWSPSCSSGVDQVDVASTSGGRRPSAGRRSASAADLAAEQLVATQALAHRARLAGVGQRAGAAGFSSLEQRPRRRTGRRQTAAKPASCRRASSAAPGSAARLSRLDPNISAPRRLRSRSARKSSTVGADPGVVARGTRPRPCRPG